MKRKETVVKRFEDAREFTKGRFPPHRRAALLALTKAAALLGAISELTWLLNTHYFSRRFVQLPISLAWSMLTMIAVVTLTQVIASLVLKLRSAKLHQASVAATARLTSLLAEYVSGEDCRDEIKRDAAESPTDFEVCITSALLGMRGFALERLCELPEVIELRAIWIEKSRKGDDAERRSAVEQLALLRDPVVLAALESALDDTSAGVVAAAVRGLLRLPAYTKRDELIRSLPGRPYLVRVLSAGESADDAARLAAASGANVELMDLARARGRSIGRGDLRPMLDDQDVQTRRSALHLVPLASPAASPARGVVMAALRHSELQMRGAAAEVAARLHFRQAIPSIAQCARESASVDTVRASCSALAALGARGRHLLHRMSAAGEAGDAPAEALGESLAASARGGSV